MLHHGCRAWHTSCVVYQRSLMVNEHCTDQYKPQLCVSKELKLPSMGLIPEMLNHLPWGNPDVGIKHFVSVLQQEYEVTPYYILATNHPNRVCRKAFTAF